MRLKYYHIFAAMSIFLGSFSLLVASQPEDANGTQVSLRFADETEAPVTVAEPPAVDESPAVAEPPPVDESPVYDLAESYEEFVGPCMTCTEVPYEPKFAARLGWWGVDTDGSKSKVGEWQGLQESSPFFDIQGLSSNGCRTIDFFATGPEGKANSAGLYFYGGPAFSMDVEYDRFIHRQGWDPILTPLGAFEPYDPTTNPPTVPSTVMWGDDELPGDDYAIRVQQLDASFKGNLTQNLSWRLNAWGMKKEGLRQSNAITHCARVNPPDGPGGSRCHIAAQGQSIDWVTMEIEPVIEARFGWLTVEYSRTMRQFDQSDELVFADYTGSDHATFGHGIGVYDMVPENTTEIDRVKLGAQLSCTTDLYAMGFLGNTHNKLRETDRKFYGADVRLSDRSLHNLRWSAYGKFNVQQNSDDLVTLDERYPDFGELADPDDPDSFFNYFHEEHAPGEDHPQVDRVYSSVGLKSRWTPFADYCDWRRRLAIIGGYEYRRIERTNSSHDFTTILDPGPPEITRTDPFTQPDSNSHRILLALQQKWSCSTSSFVRYRMIETQYPLYGITPAQTAGLDAGLNSSLPTHEDRIEIGGTWTPTGNFMLTGQISVENTYSDAPYVNFDEDRYPFLVSAWYAPTCQWSLTAGFAEFTDWINQDITLGNNLGNSRGGDPERSVPFTDAWRYTGRTDVVTLGTSYAASNQLTLTGGFEYVWGENFFDTPPSPPDAATIVDFIPYDDMPGYSRVRVETYRLSLGADYRLTCNINCYGRYNYFDYDDIATWNSGTAHMLLVGLSGVY